MAVYLARSCPMCRNYFGIVIKNRIRVFTTPGALTFYSTAIATMREDRLIKGTTAPSNGNGAIQGFPD
jgi:hypothetical protein